MFRTNALSLAAAFVLSAAAGCTLTLDPDQYAPKTAADCGAGRKPCGYKCVPIDDPSTGCGGTSCEPCATGPNEYVACEGTGTAITAPVCVSHCEVGWGNCGAGAGCETRLNVDGNCGACLRSCELGVSCNSAGYCEPDAVTAGGSLQGICGLAADPVDVDSVYYAGTDASGVGEIGWASVVSGASDGAPVWSGLGKVTSLTGNAARLLFGVGSPNASVFQIDPIGAVSIPDLLQQRPTTGDGDLVAVSGDGGWWVPPGGVELWRLQSPSLPDFAFSEAPTGRWRALAAHPVTGDAFVADDAAGGRILRVPNATFEGGLASWEEITTGAGEVGALAVRSDGGAGWELYWGDLATGDVKRLRQGLPATTIHRGAGRTNRMRMVANDWGVYWLDAGNRAVLEFDPGGAVIPLRLGGSPVDLAASVTRVFWTEGARQIFGTRR